MQSYAAKALTLSKAAKESLTGNPDQTSDHGRKILIRRYTCGRQPFVQRTLFVNGVFYLELASETGGRRYLLNRTFGCTRSGCLKRTVIGT